MKAFKKNAHKIKKWASKYKVILASQKLIRTVTKHMGRQLNRCGKVPIPIREGESISKKHEELQKTIKFQLKKAIDLGVAVGKVGMTEE
jgi:large subunit ribosomal protein L10Ae